VGFVPVLVTREANRAFVDVDSDVRLVRLQVVEGSARAATNVEHGATGVQFEQFVRAGNVDPSDDDGPNSVVNERVPDDTTIKAHSTRCRPPTLSLRSAACSRSIFDSWTNGWMRRYTAETLYYRPGLRR